jgi:hypothetical protein
MSILDLGLISPKPNSYCFILDRYQRLNDNLITAFCALVTQYGYEATDNAKEAVYQFKLQINEDTERAAEILELFFDSTIDGRTRFATVRERAYQILSPERLGRLCRYLAGEAVFDQAGYEWNVFRASSREVQGMTNTI